MEKRMAFFFKDLSLSLCLFLYLWLWERQAAMLWRESFRGWQKKKQDEAQKEPEIEQGTESWDLENTQENPIAYVPGVALLSEGCWSHVLLETGCFIIAQCPRGLVMG